MPSTNPEKATNGDGDTIEVTNRAELLAQLPLDVRHRVAALRKLQLDALHIEAEFYKAIHKLECDYQSQYAALNTRRKGIVQGSIEPTSDEIKYPLFDPSEADISADFESLCVKQAEAQKEYEGKKGVPKFWLHVLQNLTLTSDLIAEQDETILEHLIDITCDLHAEPMAYTLTFYFTPNDYFENDTLTKKYYLKCAVDADDMADFEGPEIYKTEGCEIKWKSGQNATTKDDKKIDSFFDFFTPPLGGECSKSEADASDEIDAAQVRLHLDFEVGHTIRETVVPHALLHYTLEADDDDDDQFEDYESDEEDEPST